MEKRDLNINYFNAEDIKDLVECTSELFVIAIARDCDNKAAMTMGFHRNDEQLLENQEEYFFQHNEEIENAIRLIVKEFRRQGQLKREPSWNK